jgi:Na+/H+ antiporter NhaC
MATHIPSNYTLIFLCGMVNCVIWIVVMIATQKKQEVELAREFISRLRSKEEFLSGKNWFKFAAITALFAMLVTSILFLKNLNL